MRSRSIASCKSPRDPTGHRRFRVCNIKDVSHVVGIAALAYLAILLICKSMPLGGAMFPDLARDVLKEAGLDGS